MYYPEFKILFYVPNYTHASRGNLSFSFEIYSYLVWVSDEFLSFDFIFSYLFFIAILWVLFWLSSFFW